MVNHIMKSKPDYRKLLFIACASAIGMLNIDVTAVNLALANITQDLHLSLSTAQWIINGFTIATASMMALSGRLGDKFGPKYVLCGALAVFIPASLLVGLSLNAPMIISGRILQGACLSFIFPLAILVVSQLYPENRGQTVGAMVAVAGLTQAMGPSFGGLMVHYFNWRWIFYVNVPLSLFVLTTIALFFKQQPPENTETPIPPLNVILLTGGLLLLTTALNEVTQWGIHSTVFIGLLLSALALLSIFAYTELHTTAALLNLRLLLNNAFLKLLWVRFVALFNYFCLLFCLGLLLQNVFEYSIMHSSYIMLSLTLVFGLFSLPAGKATDRFEPKPIIILGSATFCLGFILLACLLLQPTLFLLIPALAIIGFSVGLLTPSIGTAVYCCVTKEKAGTALGILFTVGFTAASLGVALAGWVVEAMSKHHLHHLMTKLTSPLTVQQINALNAAATGTHNLSYYHHLFSNEQLQLFSPYTEHAYLFGFSSMMALCGMLAFLAFFTSSRIQFPYKLKQDNSPTVEI